MYNKRNCKDTGALIELPNYAMSRLEKPKF